MNVELNRADAELQAEEAALHAELSRLASVSSELTGRLLTLRASATQVGETAIAQRAQIAPPVVDPDAGFKLTRAAREAAVRARREANATVRAQVTATKSHLQKLAHQLLADEKVVAEAHERARLVPAAAAPAPPPMRAAPPAVVAAAPAAKPQRVSPRVKMQAAVDFHSDNNFFNGFSANISDGGLFVATVNLLPLGTHVDLSFTLPSGERIESRGVVRWVREVNDLLPDAFPGIGIQFADLHPNSQSAIDQFLEQRAPLFFAEAD